MFNSSLWLAPRWQLSVEYLDVMIPDILIMDGFVLDRQLIWILNLFASTILQDR